MQVIWTPRMQAAAARALIHVNPPHIMLYYAAPRIEVKAMAHFLISTDGSKLSEKAAKQGIALAKALRARVTALHVIPQFHAFTYRAQMLLSYHTALAEDSEDAYKAATVAQASRILQFVQRAAATAGVPCKTVHVVDDQPWRAIIETAKKNKCGMIVMASHGHGGLQGVLLGSETQKVLVHADIPVLVCR
jgi:nucleotide-binding universal stress UspA family protein